eukprot:gene4263-5335_t
MNITTRKRKFIEGDNNNNTKLEDDDDEIENHLDSKKSETTSTTTTKTTTKSNEQQIDCEIDSHTDEQPKSSPLTSTLSKPQPPSSSSSSSIYSKFLSPPRIQTRSRNCGFFPDSIDINDYSSIRTRRETNKSSSNGSKTPIKLTDHIVDDGSGTFDNPLDLSSDESEDEKQKGKKKDNETTNQIAIDLNCISLKPKSIEFGEDSDASVSIEKPIVFKDKEIEITTPFSAIQPFSTIKKDIVISVLYKDITIFTASFFSTNATLLIETEEFTYTKNWLQNPKTFSNKELKIIKLKGIDKKEFNAILPHIEIKSSWLKVLYTEEKNNDEVDKDIVIARYPHPGNGVSQRDVVKITTGDLDRLEPGQYLNDSIIDFFMSPIQTAYTKISKWTSEVDIFSKDFLFIPICENFHWTLIIISHVSQDPSKATSANKPWIIYLDSLHGSRLATITNKIRQYLSLEWKYKKSDPSGGTIPERTYDGKNLPGHRAHVPKQNNFCDCGVFLLHYVELFCRVPEKNFDSPTKLVPNQ